MKVRKLNLLDESSPLSSSGTSFHLRKASSVMEKV